MTHNHTYIRRKGGLPSHLWDVHGGGTGAEDDLAGVIAVPGHNKWTWGVYEGVV